jgi:hypothetical protein
MLHSALYAIYTSCTKRGFIPFNFSNTTLDRAQPNSLCQPNFVPNLAILYNMLHLAFESLHCHLNPSLSTGLDSVSCQDIMKGKGKSIYLSGQHWRHLIFLIRGVEAISGHRSRQSPELEEQRISHNFRMCTYECIY